MRVMFVGASRIANRRINTGGIPVGRSAYTGNFGNSIEGELAESIELCSWILRISKNALSFLAVMRLATDSRKRFITVAVTL